MRVYTAVFFITESGRIPVEDFLNGLQLRTQQAFLRIRVLLEEKGPMLIEPHCKKVDKKEDIYELRFVGVEGKLRVLFFFVDKKKIIFTNGFIKKTEKLPKNELKTAVNRKRSYLGDRNDKREKS